MDQSRGRAARPARSRQECRSYGVLLGGGAILGTIIGAVLSAEAARGLHDTDEPRNEKVVENES